MNKTDTQETTGAAPEAEKRAVNESSSPQTREGEHATLVAHHSVIGIVIEGEPVRFDRAQPVRRFKVGHPERCAQYPTSVGIRFQEPRKKKWTGYRVTPDNLTYYTVENETGIIYDSRQDVPCDMEDFEATKQRFARQWRDKGYTVIGVDDLSDVPTREKN
jgi:hypothetical protein